jgi:DNA-binding NarL/FixJ family response regulator
MNERTSVMNERTSVMNERASVMDMPLTLLIVDGHRGVREALIARLQRTPGVRAVGAVECEVAVRLAREMAPDAVVYDPRTVDGDMLTVCRLLGAGRPVVVFTPVLEDGDAHALRRAGAAAVLLKGCAVSVLLAEIRAAIAAHAAHAAHGGADGRDGRGVPRGGVPPHPGQGNLTIFEF